jgi:uncharacterized protein YggT (Ycf19 family)
MINITYMILILNSVFSSTRQDEQNRITFAYVLTKKLNQLSAIYKNFKMINITYMISILNSALLLCSTRRDEQSRITFSYVLKKF